MPLCFVFFCWQASGVAVCADLQIMAEPENGKVGLQYIFASRANMHGCVSMLLISYSPQLS